MALQVCVFEKNTICDKFHRAVCDIATFPLWHGAQQRAPHVAVREVQHKKNANYSAFQLLDSTVNVLTTGLSPC